MVAGLVSVATDNATFEPGFILPSTPRTLDEYWAYGIAEGEPPPEPDEGVSNYSMLLYQFQQTQEAIANGNDDITEWAFGEIGTDITSLKSEVVEFKVVLLGVDLTNNDQMEFGNDQPWGTDLPVQPNPALGHDVGALRVRRWLADDEGPLLGQASRGDLSVGAGLRDRRLGDRHRRGRGLSDLPEPPGGL